MVAIGAHFFALAAGKRTFYTAPIKALVSEKFFALCEVFGADQVGMMTGDASVNPTRADHLRDRGDRRQPRTARRPGLGHRPGGHGRVPFLLRPRPRMGLAGAAHRTAPRAVPAHVRDARRRVVPPEGPHPSHRASDRRGLGHRATGAPDLLVFAGPHRRSDRRTGHHSPGAGVRRPLHPGRRARACPGTDQRQHVHESREGGDRRPHSANSASRRDSARPCPGSCGTASASTTRECCPSTGD